jgi:hypothetical protein
LLPLLKLIETTDVMTMDEETTVVRPLSQIHALPPPRRWQKRRTDIETTTGKVVSVAVMDLVVLLCHKTHDLLLPSRLIGITSNAAIENVKMIVVTDSTGVDLTVGVETTTMIEDMEVINMMNLKDNPLMRNQRQNRLLLIC